MTVFIASLYVPCTPSFSTSDSLHSLPIIQVSPLHNWLQTLGSEQCKSTKVFTQLFSGRQLWSWPHRWADAWFSAQASSEIQQSGPNPWSNDRRRKDLQSLCLAVCRWNTHSGWPSWPRSQWTASCALGSKPKVQSTPVKSNIPPSSIYSQSDILVSGISRLFPRWCTE